MQNTYNTNVPVNWYNDVGSVSYPHYKHVADLLIYMGAMTSVDNASIPIPNGTNYGLDEMEQNYNVDYWYVDKYLGCTFCTAAI